MTSSRKKRQHDYRLIDSCFHQKLEIHVSSSLSNKQKKSDLHTKKLLTLMTSSSKMHHHDYRLIDSCFKKNLKFMSGTVCQTNKKTAFTQTKIFLILITPSCHRHQHNYAHRLIVDLQAHRLILNIPESVAICPNVGKYASICVTLCICLKMREKLLAQ